jgi:hypothetical protein
MENNEIFKVISNCEKYAISNLGRVKNIKTNKILKCFLSNKGYQIVSLYTNNKIKKSFNIHILMGKTFLHKENENLEIDHIDRNKLNNNLENLRYVSHSENQKNRGFWVRKKNKLGEHHISYHNGYYRVLMNHSKLKFCCYFKELKDAINRRNLLLNNIING